MALLDQRLDHFDHLGDVLGGSRVALRVADPKRLPVLVEPGLDLTGDLVGIDHAPLAGLGVELVLALGVGDVVLGQVPDVGDVHDLVHPVAQVLEATAQQVREHVGAVVADVVAPVDRRAAVVHAHLTHAKRDEVPDPCGIVRCLGGLVIHPVALVRLAIRLLPVDVRLREAGLGQDVTQLRDAPEAPVVSKGAAELRAVRELEMDVVHCPILDRVEDVLVPDVVEVVVLPGLGECPLGVGSAVEVEHEHALVLQPRPRLLEVAEQRRPLLEDEVGEIEGHGHVDETVLDVQHVAPDQLDARGLLLGERGDVVRAAPGQGLRIEVHAPDPIAGATRHPGAGHGRRAAEVLAQELGGAIEGAPEDALHEVDVAGRVLHRFLVERVDVGSSRLRPGRLPAPLLLLSTHPLPSPGAVRPEVWGRRMLLDRGALGSRAQGTGNGMGKRMGAAGRRPALAGGGTLG